MGPEEGLVPPFATDPRPGQARQVLVVGATGEEHQLAVLAA